MRKSRMMQGTIAKMADRRKLDLSKSGVHFTVESSGFMDLVIETLPGNQVSVAHYYEQNGDLCQDPEIVFFASPFDGEWYAVEWTTPAFMILGRTMGGYERLVWFDENNPRKYSLKLHAQRDLAIFANKWAKNIRMQGFK